MGYCKYITSFIYINMESGLYSVNADVAKNLTVKGSLREWQSVNKGLVCNDRIPDLI